MVSKTLARILLLALRVDPAKEKVVPETVALVQVDPLSRDSLRVSPRVESSPWLRVPLRVCEAIDVIRSVVLVPVSLEILSEFTVGLVRLVTVVEVMAAASFPTVS